MYWGVIALQVSDIDRQLVGWCCQEALALCIEFMLLDRVNWQERLSQEDREDPDHLQAALCKRPPQCNRYGLQ